MVIPMNHDEFDAALKTLGYSRERFAEIVDLKSSTTVQNWAAGFVKVPGPVATLIAFMLEQPLMRPWFENRRPSKVDSQPRAVRRKRKSKIKR